MYSAYTEMRMKVTLPRSSPSCKYQWNKSNRKFLFQVSYKWMNEDEDDEDDDEKLYF